MKRYLKFLLLGLAAMAPGEYVVNILSLHSLGAYLGVLIPYTLIVSLMYFSVPVIRRILKNLLAADVALYLIWGAVGLMFEWFLIGNSPWGNPDADQFGMWSFWASLALVPRILLDPRPAARPLKRAIAITYGVYAVLVASLTALPDPDVALWLGIVAVIVFSWGFNIFFLWLLRLDILYAKTEIDLTSQESYASPLR